MNHIIQIYRKWPLRKSYIFSLEGVGHFKIYSTQEKFTQIPFKWTTKFVWSSKIAH